MMISGFDVGLDVVCHSGSHNINTTIIVQVKRRSSSIDVLLGLAERLMALTQRNAIHEIAPMPNKNVRRLGAKDK